MTICSALPVQNRFLLFDGRSDVLNLKYLNIFTNNVIPASGVSFCKFAADVTDSRIGFSRVSRCYACLDCNDQYSMLFRRHAGTCHSILLTFPGTNIVAIEFACLSWLGTAIPVNQFDAFGLQASNNITAMIPTSSTGPEATPELGPDRCKYLAEVRPGIPPAHESPQIPLHQNPASTCWHKTSRDVEVGPNRMRGVPLQWCDPRPS